MFSDNTDRHQMISRLFCTNIYLKILKYAIIIYFMQRAAKFIKIILLFKYSYCYCYLNNHNIYEAAIIGNSKIKTYFSNSN